MRQSHNTKINPTIFYTESRLLYQHPPWQHSWSAGPKTPSPVFQRPYPSRQCCWEAGPPTATKLRCIFALRWYKTFVLLLFFLAVSILNVQYFIKIYDDLFLHEPTSLFLFSLHKLILTPAASVAAVQSDLPAVTSCSSASNSSEV